MAGGGIRRTIDELFERIDRERHEFDCIVEGHKDSMLLNWLFREGGLRGARAVAVDDIDVPRTLFPGGLVQGGNRSRVIRIAELATERFAAGDVPLVCLVDRDIESLVPGPPRPCPYLLLTSGPSIESLYVEPSILDCVLTRFLEVTAINASALLDDLVEVCHELFLARAADASLSLAAGFLDPRPDCMMAEGRLTLNYVSYHERYCERSDLAKSRERYIAEVAVHRAAAGDRRLVHGHDFVSALRHLAIELGADRAIATERLVHRALRACMPVDHALSDPTIREVLGRARRHVMI